MTSKFEQAKQKLVDYIEANADEVGALGAAVESYAEFLAEESGASPLRSLAALLAEMVICYEIGEMDLFVSNHINIINHGKNYFLLSKGVPKDLTPEEQAEVDKIMKILETPETPSPVVPDKTIH